ncbi:MAG: LemA family protein [Sphingobacteriales bacterium]|nr:MAG: LemA family protein [Sphingobacteriales bacterium]
MRKISPVILILLGILLVGGCYSCNVQKGLVAQDEDVKAKWAEVQNQYQRRADLIPNLVATVKGAAKFESETYVGVAAARAGQAGAALKNIASKPVGDIEQSDVDELQKAGAEAQTAARNLINISVEAYPQLRATENFLGLQDQLEGTENRIATSRNAYNGSVQTYNTQVRQFPNNIFANMLGFRARPTFAASAEAQNAPQVQF